MAPPSRVLRWAGRLVGRDVGRGVGDAGRGEGVACSVGASVGMALPLGAGVGVAVLALGVPLPHAASSEARATTDKTPLQGGRPGYSRCVAPLWTAVIAAVAGIVGAGLGVGAGALIARRNSNRLLQSMRKARGQERRAAVYLDVAVGWHAYLQAVRPLAFPDESYPAMTSRDLSAVLRSRAQLELVGSASVQQLHDGALEGAVALINLLQSLPKSAAGEPAIAAGRSSLQVALAEIGKRVDLLEERMNQELHPRTVLTEQHVELTGRRGVATAAPQPPPLVTGEPQPPPVTTAATPPH